MWIYISYVSNVFTMTENERNMIEVSLFYIFRRMVDEYWEEYMSAW